jgi:SAM-dependent methyltransferase
MGYYEERREGFERLYWKAKPKNIFIPNGISSEAGLVPKLNLLLGLIKHDGRIIDLGCGNGLLLKLLMEKCSHLLVPFGVDFLEKSIEQAKSEILPEFKQNFFVGNVVDFSFPGKFEYIVTDPECASDEGFIPFYNKCVSALSNRGALVFFSPGDTIARLRLRKITLPFLDSSGVKWQSSAGLFTAIKRAQPQG